MKKCPKCGAEMVRYIRYEWDGQRQKVFACPYWLCPECGEKVE